MFRICPICGYAVTGSESVPSSHQTPPLGAPCTGSLFASSLGHEFETDVIKLTFEGWADHRFSFWISLLYALLEGLSGALDVERQDVDGCLYSSDNEPNNRVLVLFDDVPGGAGHVQRLAHPPQALRGGVLEEALYRLGGLCDCGGESRDTSCYGCLRNYRNQYYHDNLERGGLSSIFFGKKCSRLTIATFKFSNTGSEQIVSKGGALLVRSPMPTTESKL